MADSTSQTGNCVSEQAPGKQADDRRQACSVSPASPPYGSRWKRLLLRRIPDLTAIGILSFGVWAVADSVLHWWRTDAETIQKAGTGAQWVGESLDFPRSDQPLAFDFGDSPYTIQRETLHGSPQEAVARLEQRCLERTQEARWPAHAPTAAERELAARITEQEPLKEGADWSLYRIEYPTVMLVGVRRLAGESADRVVCWGILFPEGETRWKLFLFHPTARSTAESPHDDVPLPPGARRSLRVRSEIGGGLSAFRGPGTLQTWLDHFENWRNSLNLPLVTFRQHNHTATLRVRSPAAKPRAWIDIQLRELNNGEVSGLIVVSPFAHDAPEQPTP